MYEFLLKAYLDKSKNVGVVQIEYAAERGWITLEERDKILAYIAEQEAQKE